MANLSKWNPFKFSRRERDDNKKTKTGTLPVRHASTAGQPAHPVQLMQRMMEPMFSERWWNDPFAPMSMMNEIDRFFGDFAPSTFQPNIDVVDEKNHIKVTAELPGLSAEDVDLSIDEGVLTLRGEKKEESETDEDGCYRLERYFGQFQRSVPLPAEIDSEKAEAKFDKGVLTVRLPKTGERRRSRKIPLS